MAAPKGNQYGKGKGRKSAAVEKASGDIVKSIILGKYKMTPYPSGWNTVAKKIWEGTSDSVLNEVLRKLVPDMLDVSSKGGVLPGVVILPPLKDDK